MCRSGVKACVSRVCPVEGTDSLILLLKEIVLQDTLDTSKYQVDTLTFISTKKHIREKM